MLDVILAIIHHLLILAIAAVLFGEVLLVRRDMGSARIGTVARIDGVFGAFAAALLVVGFLRVFLGAKPEAFYLQSPFFWAKIAAFAAVGLLSIAPTLRFIRWNRAALADATYSPPPAELGSVRRFLRLEVAVFVLIPTFAAIMARGYGL